MHYFFEKTIKKYSYNIHLLNFSVIINSYCKKSLNHCKTYYRNIYFIKIVTVLLFIFLDYSTDFID